MPSNYEKSTVPRGLFLWQISPYLGEAYDKNKAMMLSRRADLLLFVQRLISIKTAAEGILKGQFAINPYSEKWAHIAPFVEQFKSITGWSSPRSGTVLDQIQTKKEYAVKR